MSAMEAAVVNFPEQRLDSNVVFTFTQDVDIAETSPTVSEGSNSYLWFPAWKICESLLKSKNKI